ncbi:MAG: hypothetical protein ACRDHY_11030 [Anaerolineales bacterium]
MEQATRGLNLARQVGASRLKVYNLRALGMLHRELEDYNGAWPFDHEAADLSRLAGGSWRPVVLSGLALDAAALGRLDDARALLSDARREIGQQETRVDFLQEVAYAAGRLHLAAGEPGAALTEARELHRLAEEAGSEHWRGPGFLLEADALMAEGDPPAALRRYQDAVQESERLGRLPLLWRALAGAVESQQGLGRSADAASGISGT